MAEMMAKHTLRLIEYQRQRAAMSMARSTLMFAP